MFLQTAQAPTPVPTITLTLVILPTLLTLNVTRHIRVHLK